MFGTRQTQLLHDNGIRAMHVDVRGIAAHAAELHGLGSRAAALQADGLAAAVLLGAYLDDHERLTLQLQLERPRMAFTADVYWDGRVRCRTTPANVGRGEPLTGVMLVLKSVHGREVYRGATAVEHSDLGAVLQEHLRASSQVPACVRVSNGTGVFVEKMPGQAESVDLEQLAVDIADGFDGIAMQLRWECSCGRDRVLNMLRTLGEAEIQSMIDEDDGASVECNFCRSTTVLSADDLRTLLST